ncbi:MAG: PH domain-containing protein, partial [Lachnospiraceae bacterium]|nr:PH domain-containing protein [Lachnospiraceae bacterium]
IYMKKEDARMFADKIIPEFRLVHDFVMQPRKVYIYKSIVYVIIMEAISVSLLYVLGYWWIPVIGLIAGMIIGFMGYASYGLKIMDDYIVLKTGIFAMKTKTINFNRIDQIVLEQNIIHRAMGLEKLELKSRGKLGKETSNTGYYKVGTFSETVAEFSR